MADRGMIVAGLLSAIALGVSAQTSFGQAQGSALKLEKGDHICLIGNTLGERTQHDGWLETLIQARFPQDELTFRNLCVAADEINQRIRVDGFGTPDEWLEAASSDVIFAFFGFNESFAGPKGLDQFKKDLDAWVKHTLGQKYNHKSAPRLVLFSSIAQQKLPDPNFPEPERNNRNLKIYADAMAQAAKANGVTFIDLYAPTLDLYDKAGKALTIDCIHLNDDGGKAVAGIIVNDLFGPAPDRGDAALEKLRQAVLDKDFYWFNRYRTNDGYNVYGGRSYEKYEGVTNREVLQREMQVLDVMTANRDKRIWAVAQGKDLEVSDDNTPPFISVPTNAPGPLPDKRYPYPDAKEAINYMKLGAHLKVNLVADEKQFPDLANPVQMAFDTKGRLVVAVIPSYPHWRPKDEMNDKILIFDLDEQGRAVKQTIYADHLNCPTGFEFYKGGMFVATCPDLLYLKDTTGGDHANFRQRVLEGLGVADTHHQANSFVFDPGGALYFQEGTFSATQVETLWGPLRCVNAGVYRFEPTTHRFEAYASYPFANPHGHVFDYWGEDFVTDGTGNVNYYGAGFSGHVDYPDKHGHYRPYFHQRTRPCPGTEILSSRHFPDDMQGNLLDLDVIQFQGILQYKIKEEGSGFVGAEVEPIIQGRDVTFRPSAAQIGPDGAIYFLDWSNPLIGHLQHHLRDPNRDHIHGRIYRITYDGRPLLTPAKISGQPVEHLLELLKEPENRTRYRAKIELSDRDPKQVIASLKDWIVRLDKNDPNYQHNLIEALWVYQWENEVNEPLLKQMLRSPESHARAAATRVLCYWRDRIEKPLELLRAQVNDDNPRVRLEAVRACSFFQTSDAADVALESLNKPQDYYLKYVLDETMRTLDKYNKR